MELYLLKSAACLGVFFVFYKVALENTSLHTSKRIYLLGSLLVSFIIPFVTFTTYVEVAPIAPEIYTSFPTGIQVVTELPVAETNYLPYVLGIIYGIGVLFFGTKFIRNLFRIFKKITNNPNIKKNAFYHVLTTESIAPHTFFNRLFFNKKAYEAREFPQEVFWHEEAHASQKHSADLLFIELLQVVFWFNPLFFFFKRAVKLNHEFLADREVLHKTEDVSQYQQILLSFTTPDHLRGQSLISFANSINYSSIKKRFTVMKIHTSRRAGWLKGLLLLPLLALLTYGFSSTKQEFITSEIAAISETGDKIEPINILIDEKSRIFLNGKIITIDQLLDEVNNLNKHLTVAQKRRYLEANIDYENEKDKVTTERILEILRVANVSKMGVGNLKNQRESNLKPFRSELVGKTVEEAELILKEREKRSANRTYQTKNSDSPWGITLSEPFEVDPKTGKKITPPALPTTPKVLKGQASQLPPPSRYSKTLPEYQENTGYYYKDKLIPRNKAAKLLLENKNLRFIISNSGNNRTIITIVENSQLPPPPPPASMGDVKKKYEYSYVLYINGKSIYLEGKKVALNKFAKAMDAHTKNWPASAYKLYGVSTKRDNVSEDFIKKLNKEYRKTKLAQQSSSKEPYIFAPAALNLPPPPPPPGPEKPLEHVIAMAKRNATFYFEMIDIAPDAAIKMVKKNPSLHIETRLNDPNPPKVYISQRELNWNNSNLKYETIASIKAMKADEPKNGYFLLKGETFLFTKEGENIQYFDRWGRPVNEKGEEIINNQQNKNPKYETIASIKAMKADEPKSGYFLLKGETFFFVKEGDKIQYFDRWGNLVNEKGEKITPSPFKQEQQKLNNTGILNNPVSTLFSEGDEGIKTTKQYKFPNDTKDAAHALKVISNYEVRNPKFSFEGKTITATEAKSILKKNPTYNLNVTEYATSFKKRVEIEIIPE